MKEQVWQLWIAIDQLLSVLIGLVAYPTVGRFHWADETFSAMAWRLEWNAAVRIIDGIFFWQNEHCRQSYESEMERRHTAPAYRGIEGDM